MPLYFDGKAVRVVPKRGAWTAEVGFDEYRVYRINGKYVAFKNGSIYNTKEFLEELEVDGVVVDLQNELGEEVIRKLNMQAVMEQV